MRARSGELRLAGRLALTLLALCPMPVLAQASMPASQQLPLLLKVLTYDRQFEAKASPKVVIGIVFVPTDAESLSVTNEMISALRRARGKTVKGLPIDHVTVPFTTERQLETAVREQGINVFYVAQGSEEHLDAVLRVSRGKRVTTTTGVPSYVGQGVAVGIGLRLGKPQIFINLEAAKSEGSEFDATLLRIATVVP
jgi:hypothetical protein